MLRAAIKSVNIFLILSLACMPLQALHACQSTDKPAQPKDISAIEQSTDHCKNKSAEHAKIVKTELDAEQNQLCDAECDQCLLPLANISSPAQVAGNDQPNQRFIQNVSYYSTTPSLLYRPPIM